MNFKEPITMPRRLYLSDIKPEAGDKVLFLLHNMLAYNIGNTVVMSVNLLQTIYKTVISFIASIYYSCNKR